MYNNKTRMLTHRYCICIAVLIEIQYSGPFHNVLLCSVRHSFSRLVVHTFQYFVRVCLFFFIWRNTWFVFLSGLWNEEMKKKFKLK